SSSSRTRRSRTSTASTRCSGGWSPASTCSAPSRRVTASGAFIGELTSRCSHAEVCARNCPGFSLWIGAAHSPCPLGARPIRVLRAKQDPVPRLRLARAARRARRPLLLSRGAGARPCRADVRRGELRRSGAALQSPPPPAHPAHHLRLALRFRADQRPAVRAARGTARRDGVLEAARGPAVHRQLFRFPPHPAPRAGARLPAEPHEPGVRALSPRAPRRPAAVAAEPLSITARVLTKLAIKPAVYGAPERADSARGVLYFSPSTGYTNIYAQSFAGGRPRAVVKGERSAEFESFHFFESRIGVSSDGIVAFSSKYFDRDALFFWSLEKGRVVGRYQFPGLVSILSPAWVPDRQSVVFSGLAV